MEHQPLPPSSEADKPQLRLVSDVPLLGNQESFTDLARIIKNPTVNQPLETRKHGQLNHELAIMEDGDAYPITTATPKHSRSDTAIVFTTAWLTSTRGHNRHTMLRLMQLGYPVIMIGPEGEVRSPELTRKERFEHALHSDMYKIVHDMNRILDAKLPAEKLRENEIIVLGESRAAMTGFGLDVPQFSGRRRAAYTDLTAPCFARPPKLEELPDIALQLVPEGLTLVKLGFKLFGKRLRHYGATLHDDPEYYFKELLKVPQLMSGKAGSLAMATRVETPTHIRDFTKDGWSQTDEWPDMLGHKHTSRIELAHGYHLDIADPATLRNQEHRLDALAEARGFDGSFDGIGFNAIMEAHLIRQNRSRPVGKTVLRVA